MKKTTITTTVNGQIYTREVPVNMTLVEFLRDELHLNGTKEGCDEGECGACTIIFDGHPFNSCLVLASEANGHEITTIEGMAHDGRLHPIQEAFLEVGAVQCGYCTPGMILSAKVVLDEFPDPTEEQIRTGIEGNICRCTGYNRIVSAIQLAAKKINTAQGAE
jgi:carbon-monoxide dehydrogenase small subunit